VVSTHFQFLRRKNDSRARKCAPRYFVILRLETLLASLLAIAPPAT
jgi:hypothetical protein